ncbi:MAG: NosD domain-containing protein [Candidatus Pacearchaeota archaeon]|jgi:parallel beta-helix repeat protein
MKKRKSKITTTILLLISIIFILSISIAGVYASCIVPYNGMVINKSTVFCQGNYFLTNGIKINSVSSNITILDCNNSRLIGDSYVLHYKTGVLVNSSNAGNITIKNCNVVNYTNGFFVQKNKLGVINFFNNTATNNTWFGFRLEDNRSNLIGNTGSNNGFYGFYILSQYNYLENNTASNNYMGFELSSSEKNIARNNILIGNYIKNNTQGEIELNMDTENNTITKNTMISNNISLSMLVLSINNQIWDNDIYFLGIYDFNYLQNTYCVNCIGNRYYNGALGPTCPFSCKNCTDADNDEVCDNEDLCLNTKKGVEIDKDGCSQIQFCARQPICGSGCDNAHWKEDIYPKALTHQDCITIIVENEGKLEPRCAALVCSA